MQDNIEKMSMYNRYIWRWTPRHKTFKNQNKIKKEGNNENIDSKTLSNELQMI
jgi:hypothetical protein